MKKAEFHCVDGVGKQIIRTSNQPFNPETFEQAIHGLQDTIFRLGRFDDSETFEDETYTATHEFINEDNEKLIKVDTESVLYDVTYCLPKKWDVTILTDIARDDGYAVRASAECGGGVIVYITIFVQGGGVRRFDVGHSDLTDNSKTIDIKHLTKHSSGRELAHLNRYLERTVLRAYGTTITSAASTFDYVMTKPQIPALGKHNNKKQKRETEFLQNEWAAIREKTEQTISDNVRTARDQIYELPDGNAFTSVRPALEQLDPDGDDLGDIRLV